MITLLQCKIILRLFILDDFRACMRSSVLFLTRSLLTGWFQTALRSCHATQTLCRRFYKVTFLLDF